MGGGGQICLEAHALWSLSGNSLGPFLVIVSSGEQEKSQEHSVRFVGDTKAVGLCWEG